METISHNQPYIDHADEIAVVKTLRSKWIAQGRISKEFESKMARLLGRRFARATSSGTTALHLALLALGLRKGDEVILSTYTCTALLNAVFYVGAAPRLADIDGKNLGPSLRSIRSLMNRRTRAVIVNHAFGFPASIEKIQSLGIPVIEDCAQALGSSTGKRPLGSFGDITICSFYATKMMTAGCGGMVLTDNKKWAGRIEDLTNCDQRRDYKVRYNYSISDLNAALGLSQLAKLSEFVKRRREIAARYIKTLQPTRFYYWAGQEDESPNFYRFLVGDTQSYQPLIKKLRSHGIQAISPIEPYQLLHRYLKLPHRQFPVAELVSRSVFSLPIYPALQDQDAAYICKMLKKL